NRLFLHASHGVKLAATTTRDIPAKREQYRHVGRVDDCPHITPERDQRGSILAVLNSIVLRVSRVSVKATSTTIGTHSTPPFLALNTIPIVYLAQAVACSVPIVGSL